MPQTSAAVVLEVDLGAIVANWRDLGGRHPAGRVAAVLKADAYGLGAAAVAPALFAAGCRHFFVATLDEALAIRDLVPGAMLAVLNGMWPGDAPIYRAQGIVPVLGCAEDIAAWGGQGPYILHVETGMNRLGLPIGELLSPLEPKPIFVMSHLVSAELPEDPVNALQLQRFEAARAVLPGVPSSLANSSGLFLGPEYGFELGRPGAALYGINPVPGRANPMRNVVRLRAMILQVKQVRAGEGVGYNATWLARRDSRIAVVSVGYADGYLRSLTNQGAADFDGTAVPLVGRVSMDLTTFDVTDVPQAVPGCWLELIGSALPPDEVAQRAGTNGYEILTSLGRRYHRAYRPA